MYRYFVHSLGRLIYPVGAFNHSLVRPGGFPYASGVSRRTYIDLPACHLLHFWRYRRSFVPSLRAQILRGNGEKAPSFSVASVSGTVLRAFFYSGPAINVLAIALTARILAPDWDYLGSSRRPLGDINRTHYDSVLFRRIQCGSVI
jgi:hypothetical protein